MDRAKPGLIAVDADGKRFVNEAISYHEFVRAQLANADRAIPAWLICDRKFLWKYGLGKVRPFSLSTRANVASGYLKWANTIKALAEATVVPAESLQATIKSYNEYAERGEDPDFGKGGNIYQRHLGDAENKPNPCVAPITDAPFYAVAVRPADLGMSSGIVTDPQARVLRPDGSAIDGLYACGNDMASVMEGAYPGPGITLGPAITFGWLAGRNAAAGKRT
jgi:succinate dehydrogenase/fumarate reductase flavoprotein subunit